MKTESGSIGGIHCSKPFWEQMQAYCVTCESLVGFRFLSNSSTRLHSRHRSANHSSHSLCPSYQKKKKGFCGLLQRLAEETHWTTKQDFYDGEMVFYNGFVFRQQSFLHCIQMHWRFCFSVFFFVPLHRANVKLPSLLCRRAHRRFFTPPDFFVILIYL